MTTAIRFPPDVHEALRETADELGVSINWLVVKLTEEGMERMDLTNWTMVREPRSAVSLRSAEAHSQHPGTSDG